MEVGEIKNKQTSNRTDDLRQLYDPMKTNVRWDDPQFPTLCLSGHTDEVIF